jgi:prepilin-type processing-associated H-X9-DG protein
MGKESAAEVKGIDMAARAQREAFLSEVAAHPEARADAVGLVRQQEQALQAVRSNVLVTELESLLRVAAAKHRGGPMETAAGGARLIAESVKQGSRDAVWEVHRQMRDRISEWAPHSELTPAAFRSPNANFAAADGHVTIFAKPGASGEIHADLRDGSTVTATYKSNEYGDISWDWRVDGHLRQDSEHRSSGAHRLTFNLNLERTTERESKNDVTEKTDNRSEKGIEAGAKLPVKAVTVEAKGAYRGAESTSREQRVTEAAKEPSGSSKLGLTFEVKWTEKPKHREHKN